jgi:sugar phosphate isomerase/epimerase
MTKEYAMESWEKTLDHIAAQGMHALHLNPASAGLTPEDTPLSLQTAYSLTAAVTARGLEIASISGTYNMIHPDPAVRASGYKRLAWLIRCAALLGVPYVTLCTGTLDPDNMWRAHPGNNDPACFQLLEHELEPALALCSEVGVNLLVEPETSNVVNTPEKAAQLLRDIASPNLFIAIDAANLFHHGETAMMRETLARAIHLLSPYIRMAHAKDIVAGTVGYTRPGLGVVDFPFYLWLLRQSGFDGAIILHGFPASELSDAAAYITSIWEG